MSLSQRFAASTWPTHPLAPSFRTRGAGAAHSFGQIQGTIDLTPPPAIYCHGFFRDNLYGLQTNLTLNGVPFHELDIGNISFLPGN